MPGDLRLALENVRALATRAKVYGWRPEDADHLLRFCAGAGVESSPLRAPSPEPESASNDATDACYYCHAEEWETTATLIRCRACGATWGRCDGTWRVDPETIPPPAAPAPRPPRQPLSRTLTPEEIRDGLDRLSPKPFDEDLEVGAPAPRPPDDDDEIPAPTGDARDLAGLSTVLRGAPAPRPEETRPPLGICDARAGNVPHERNPFCQNFRAASSQREDGGGRG